MWGWDGRALRIASDTTAFLKGIQRISWKYLIVEITLFGLSLVLKSNLFRNNYVFGWCSLYKVWQWNNESVTVGHVIFILYKFIYYRLQYTSRLLSLNSAYKFFIVGKAASLSTSSPQFLPISVVLFQVTIILSLIRNRLKTTFITCNYPS